MNVRLVMVSSVNGKITHADNPHIYTWTSPEDKKRFFSHISDSTLIVMGSKTYEASRKTIVLSPDKLRLVLTHAPEKYTAETVPGSLEFTKESPHEIVARMEERGYTQLLLVGGPVINSLFIEQGLVDELHLTIEPRLFGQGKNLISASDVSPRLILQNVERLNDQGTLYLVYAFEKSPQS